ncbi:MAG: tetraacyldisaccharide 4'-kinase, partial [Candidatus Omnitrophica bacterium]|nr:tetraacyldisaccharide 4'-kinase [Candidatus Omnitrophota bacterium]
GDGYESMGDEPYMLKMNLKDVPVIVDSDRIRAAKSAIQDYGVDTVILDDGMQQWRIKKDLEIVSIDSVLPFGNRHLIPRGILREPLSSLKRADVFVLTKTNLSPDVQSIKNFLGRINPRGLIAESVHNPVAFYKIDRTDDTVDINTFKGKYVALFSGIGEPGSFEDLINRLGIKAGMSFRFADHHNYTREDLDKIAKSSYNKGIDIIITTEKDAVRLNSRYLPHYNLQFYYLRIELKIKENEQEFHNRLLGLYSY